MSLKRKTWLACRGRSFPLTRRDLISFPVFWALWAIPQGHTFGMWMWETALSGCWESLQSLSREKEPPVCPARSGASAMTATRSVWRLLRSHASLCLRVRNRSEWEWSLIWMKGSFHSQILSAIHSITHSLPISWRRSFHSSAVCAASLPWGLCLWSNRVIKRDIKFVLKFVLACCHVSLQSFLITLPIWQKIGKANKKHYKLTVIYLLGICWLSVFLSVLFFL